MRSTRRKNATYVVVRVTPKPTALPSVRRRSRRLGSRVPRHSDRYACFSASNTCNREERGQIRITSLSSGDRVVAGLPVNLAADFDHHRTVVLRLFQYGEVVRSRSCRRRGAEKRNFSLRPFGVFDVDKDRLADHRLQRFVERESAELKVAVVVHQLEPSDCRLLEQAIWRRPECAVLRRHEL